METKDDIKVPASNPFDALFDEDCGDDVINNAVEQLMQLKQASNGSKSDKTNKGKSSKNEKEKVNNTVVKANNKNSSGGYSNNSGYQNGANNGQKGAGGERGAGNSNNSGYQNGANNGQKGAGGKRGSGNSNNSGYQNGANNGQKGAGGERGAGNSNNSGYQNGANNGQKGAGGERSGLKNSQISNIRYQNGTTNGQRERDGSDHRHNNNNRFYQNGWYLRGNGAKSKSSSRSRSSNGTDDGASDKADRSSLKSYWEQREEEELKKLKEFIYDPQEEDKWIKFLAKEPEIIAEKIAAVKKVEALHQEEEKTGKVQDSTREKLDNAVKEKIKVEAEKVKALEYIKLSDRKKMTLDEYEKIKEERRQALGVLQAERRVVQSSDFDGMMAVVAKKNMEEEEDSLSLSVMPVHKMSMEPEKTEKAQRIKKKKAPLLTIGGSQSQGVTFSEQQNKRRDHVGPHPQVQSIQQNVVEPSFSLDSTDFPALPSAAGA